MGIKRIVDTSFWTDGKVDEFSPEDKYFMLYLLTNPFTTQLGIYEISIKQFAFQLGYSIEAVSVLLDRFETKYDMIRYSKNTKEVAIKNYLRHSIIKGGAPVRDCLIKELKNVKNKELIEWVFLNVKNHSNINETVKNIITEYEEQNGVLKYCNEKDNENDNDNENDVSYHESCNDTSNDSSTNRSPKKSKPVKHKYGEYNNVLLTDDELSKLKTEYSDYEARIENLSSYIASTGKAYKSHYATIRNWARKDKEKQPQRPARPSNNRFNNFEQRNNDFESMVMERFKEKRNNPPKTAADDPALAARVEEMRKRLV